VFISRSISLLKKTVRLALLLALSLGIGASACDKDRTGQETAVKKLFAVYSNGEISECHHKGARVYSASVNAHDAETRIYDAEGKETGSCFYSTGAVDAICNDLDECETIYRCTNHISGQPAVDKYGLSK
jgi:hypothetical protein